jgi:hypothetical protein
VYVTGGTAAIVAANITDIRPGGLHLPMVFANAAARDALLTAPQYGDRCFLLDTWSDWIYRDTNTWHSPPKGFVGQVIGPTSAYTLTTGYATVPGMSLSVNMLAGRLYKVTAKHTVTITTAGVVLCDTRQTAGPAYRSTVNNASLSAGSWYMADTGIGYWTSPTSVAATIALQASLASGAGTYPAGASMILVEDMGV